MVRLSPLHIKCCFILLSNILRLLGKYVGNRPIKLRKADNNIRPVEIGHRKAKQLERDLRKNRGKPY